MILKLSKTKKMPCKSLSFEATEEICKGMIDFITKKMKPVCKGCYAKKGFYNIETEDCRSQCDFTKPSHTGFVGFTLDNQPTQEIKYHGTNQSSK